MREMLLEVLNGNLKYNPRQPCLGTRCTLLKLCKEVLGKQQQRGKEEKLDSRSSNIVPRHFPSIHIWPPAKTSVHLNSDHLKMFQIGRNQILSDKVIVGRISSKPESHCFGLPSVCCGMCASAKPGKCEICLAGFPANDGVNFAQMMARICANCWLSHFQLNRCVKTTGFSSATRKNFYKFIFSVDIYGLSVLTKKRTFIHCLIVWNQGVHLHSRMQSRYHAMSSHLSTLIIFHFCLETGWNLPLSS